MTITTIIRGARERQDPVERVSVTRLELPLRVPYKLAFRDVAVFDTIIAEVSLGGQTGIGEATILTGYTPETVEGAWETAKHFASAIAGQPAETAMRLLLGDLERSPFTVTMFGSAIEMAENARVLENSAPAEVPLLFGLNPTEADAIDRELDRAFEQGYKTVKVKVGFEVAADLERVRHIQTSNAGRMTLRVDGNQGYDRADGMKFASAVSPENIELLEQPCHMDDWAALTEVIKVSAVPIMLDESIYGASDIERAADIGASFVKLKLMKMGSLAALCSGLERIGELGMTPVLGNGVASDIGCWMEACVARDHLPNAGELNGFLRTSSAIVTNPLAVENGAIQLPQGYRPELDRDAMDRFRADAFSA